MPPISTPSRENTDTIVEAQSTDSIFKWPSGKKLIVYHTCWSTYGRNYQIKDIPIDYITDINYAFFNIQKNTQGNYVPMTGDAWADFDQRMVNIDKGLQPLDSWNEDKPFYGNFGQFKKLIDAGKKFNLGLSIGGWTWSQNFSLAVRTQESRKAFVDEIIAIFDKFPIFNSVDYDWEYPSKNGKVLGMEHNIAHPDDGKNFVALLKLTKDRLKATGRSHYQVTCCVAADPAKLDEFPAEAFQYLDSVNCMTYDF